MGRAPCCDKAKVKKGPWSPEEDIKLKEYIEKYGTGSNWIALPYKAGLKRCGKSCRLRWLNYLRPNIRHGQFSDDEDTVICSLFASIGSRWSIIAAQLPGRTDNDIKNYWNTKLKKKFLGSVPPSHTQTTKPIPSLFQTPPQNENYYSSKSEPLSSIPSSFFNTINRTRTTLLESQENLVAFMHQQSCSSSDGSCNQISYNKETEYYCNGEEDPRFMLSNGGYPEWSERTNGLWNDSETPLPLVDYYGVEGGKQMVSSDESKAQQGRVMYL